MRWCLWCGEELKYVAGKGWLHPNGELYKTFVGADGEVRDDHCAFPTDDQVAAARVAFGRGEEKAKERRGNLNQKPEDEERDTETIAGKFAEALEHIEDAICYLAQVNEQYDLDDSEEHIDDIRPYNSAMDFWLQAELAEQQLKDILNRLQRVERLVPKEGER